MNKQQKLLYWRKRNKAWYATHRAEKLARNKRDWKAYSSRIRAEALEHYGGAICVCCGETNPLFLTLDHKNNDGGKWRIAMANAAHQHQMGKRFLQGSNFYLWLRRNKWPDMGLQVACYNCNLGRTRNKGICPHITPLA